MAFPSEDALNSLTNEELLFLKAELERELFVRAPVSPEVFLTDPSYLGSGAKALYPLVKSEIIKYQSNPDIVEVIAAGSIGWGKSYGVTASLTYDLYKLSVLKNPQQYFGLSPDSEIAMINTATTGTTAKATIFGSLKSMIDNSPYFKELFPRDSKLEGTLRFPNKISFYVGNSSELGALGQNIMSAVIDEANFLEAAKMSKVGKNTTDDSNQATVLYNALQRRLKSRFLSAGKVPGKIYLISSAVHPKDFISRKIENAERNKDKTVYIMKFAQWDTKPEGTFSGEKFKVMIGNDLVPSKILAPGEEKNITSEFRIVDVPIEYYRDFEDDIAGSLRDIAGEGVSGKNKFITNGSKVRACLFDEYQNPVVNDIIEIGLNDDIGTINDYLDEESLRAIRSEHANCERYIHVDMSLKGDRLGFAMGHRYLATGRQKIRTDLLFNLKAKKGDEIPLHHIRHFVLDLRDKYGFKIKRVSFDQFQSADSQQILKKMRFEVEQISVDRTSGPYETLKGLIYAEDMEMYENDMLLRELFDLEKDFKVNKVDHPAVGGDGLPGSKDLADALCGVVASITKDYDMGTYDSDKMMGIIDLVSEMQRQEMIDSGEDDSWLTEDYEQNQFDRLKRVANSLGGSLNIRTLREGILLKIEYNALGKVRVKNEVVPTVEEAEQKIVQMLSGGDVV